MGGFFLGAADLGPGGKGKRSFREREIFFFPILHTGERKI